MSDDINNDEMPWDDAAGLPPKDHGALPVDEVAAEGINVSSLYHIPEARAYLNRIGAEARGWLMAVRRRADNRGYWHDVATIRFKEDGTITCSDPNDAPTEDEKRDIERAFARAIWPKAIAVKTLRNLPPRLREAKEDDLFLFRNLDGEIVFVQQRVEEKAGKAYLPWTPFDDGPGGVQWRMCEPPGPLPIYNLDLLKKAASTSEVAFIHEGAKSAEIAQRIADGKKAGHPWEHEFAGAVHVGWIGGALNPARTDFSVLEKNGIKRAYIVADNDHAGRTAIAPISRALSIPAFSIIFPDEFSVGFDAADDMPERMFQSDENGERIYVGPAFRSLVGFATWATYEVIVPVPGGQPKRIVVIRDAFAQQVVYAEADEVFVFKDWPDRSMTRDAFNATVRKFSHAKDTAELLLASKAGERVRRMAYRPDKERERFIALEEGRAINCYVPPTVRRWPKADEAQPFHDFMEYLVPEERDRKNMMRWLATMIARPDIRMGYGLLLVTEHQGIGKNTLTDHILAPLVGWSNVSHPGETDIVDSQFNGWAQHKRLVIVSEIYHGHSWKAYNRMKSISTDAYLTINEKYRTVRRVENWAHPVCCSNSLRALKMDSDDRRWLVPKLNEKPWPRERFDAFYNWLRFRAGLQKIAAWAHSFSDYVKVGERPPSTNRKTEMIHETTSEALKEALALYEAIAEEVWDAEGVAEWERAKASVEAFDLQKKRGDFKEAMESAITFTRRYTHAKINGHAAPRPIAMTAPEIREHCAEVCRSMGLKMFDQEADIRSVTRRVDGVEVYPHQLKIGGRWTHIIVNAEAKAMLDEALEEIGPDGQRALVRLLLTKPSELISVPMTKSNGGM
jgi:hypothetical protein